MLCKCKLLITTPVFLSSEPVAAGMKLAHEVPEYSFSSFGKATFPLFSFSSPFFFFPPLFFSFLPRCNDQLVCPLPHCELSPKHRKMAWGGLFRRLASLPRAVPSCIHTYKSMQRTLKSNIEPDDATSQETHTQKKE